ncbi:unnamed protein product [Penicillium roqueforti FM164]|uniref:Uncharacterized protein n=1 Tax=Penicillium roqueforti (strain FM164) TaxID=1365484 RepID=W6QK91_PENRF|nr:unnamed protein product [Penicillium roqueforti FM164]
MESQSIFQNSFSDNPSGHQGELKKKLGFVSMLGLAFIVLT